MKKTIKFHQKRMAKIAVLGTALKETGFGVCHFSSEDEECDQCDKQMKKSDKIYYRRTCYDVEEGEYFCGHCVVSEAHGNMEDYYQAMADSCQAA